MTKDPRHLNVKFDISTIGHYLHDYAQNLEAALLSVDEVSLIAAQALIEGAAEAKNRIFAIGNGGSAAIADHLCCDYVKGTQSQSSPTIDACSLSSNVALYSAIANDYGFESVFSAQIEFVARRGDVLIAISSSGNSKNILNAVSAARAAGVGTIGLSGFSGGALKDAVDVSLHVAINNYGVVEDAHQALMHILAQYIACKRDAVNPAQNQISMV